MTAVTALKRDAALSRVRTALLNRSRELTWRAFRRFPDHHAIVRPLLHGEGYSLVVAEEELVAKDERPSDGAVVVAYRSYIGSEHFDIDDALYPGDMTSEGVEQMFHTTSRVIPAGIDLVVSCSVQSSSDLADALYDLAASGRLHALSEDSFKMWSVTGRTETLCGRS